MLKGNNPQAFPSRFQYETLITAMISPSSWSATLLSITFSCFYSFIHSVLGKQGQIVMKPSPGPLLLSGLSAYVNLTNSAWPAVKGPATQGPHHQLRTSKKSNLIQQPAWSKLKIFYTHEAHLVLLPLPFSSIAATFFHFQAQQISTSALSKWPRARSQTTFVMESTKEGREQRMPICVGPYRLNPIVRK